MKPSLDKNRFSLSKKFWIRTFAITVYFLIFGEAWTWLLSPLITLYGEIIEYIGTRSKGIIKHGLRFLLYASIIYILVIWSRFVQAIPNGNIATLVLSIGFGFFMSVGFVIREKTKKKE